jgi:hypothetical protein
VFNLSAICILVYKEITVSIHLRLSSEHSLEQLNVTHIQEDSYDKRGNSSNLEGLLLILASDHVLLLNVPEVGSEVDR